MKHISYPYTEILDWQGQLFPEEIILQDHLGGHKQNRSNIVLDKLNTIAKTQDNNILVKYHSILDCTVTDHYPNLTIKFDHEFQNHINLKDFWSYNIHPEINYKNFICSFNGSPHVSRKLLVAIIKKFGWFDPDYCSKNFAYNVDTIDGHVSDYFSAEQRLVYNKIFNNAEEFNQTIYTFGHNRYDHDKNIYTLEHKLTESFLHVVSETMATSYYPFVTEKFLYSVVTRGLFLAYAQPGWHAHLEKYYGFKRYTKLFDYRFDSIENPVERLVELMSMISKFNVLSSDDWKDLYLLEQDTIEYNYNHYFSQDYLKCLAKFS